MKLGWLLALPLTISLLAGCPGDPLVEDGHPYEISNVGFDYIAEDEVVMITFDARWRPRYEGPRPAECSIAIFEERGHSVVIGGVDFDIQTAQDTITKSVGDVEVPPDDVLVNCSAPLSRPSGMW